MRSRAAPEVAAEAVIAPKRAFAPRWMRCGGGGGDASAVHALLCRDAPAVHALLCRAGGGDEGDDGQKRALSRRAGDGGGDGGDLRHTNRRVAAAATLRLCMRSRSAPEAAGEVAVS